MAAFDRVQSGIPQMDTNFDNIRLGDNVVWRVDNLDEFKYFVDPYVQQAIKDKRNLIYIRFASHEPLKSIPEISGELSIESDEFTDVVKIYDLSEDNFILFNDMKNEYIICYKGK